MPRHKQSQRKQIVNETRQNLLEAATGEFARHGYAAANINRISTAAGFAKGTVYNYFPSKRDLMLALIDEVAAAHLGFVAEQVLAESDAARRLQRFFQAGFTYVENQPAAARMLITTLYGPDAEFKEAMYRAYQPMFGLVSRDILAYGMAQGAFQPMDSQATAALLMTIYLGSCSQVDERGRPWLPAQQVTAFALNALRR